MIKDQTEGERKQEMSEIEKRDSTIQMSFQTENLEPRTITDAHVKCFLPLSGMLPHSVESWGTFSYFKVQCKLEAGGVSDSILPLKLSNRNAWRQETRKEHRKIREETGLFFFFSIF